MEGASGSSRSPGSPGGVARGGGGSWKSRRDHLAEPGGALRWLGRSQGPPGRCWPGAGRAEPGLWAPGSRLPSGGLRAAQEAGGAAWGDGCPGSPGAGGQAARRRQRPPGALAEVLKGQLPAKAQPGRAASGRGQTGQDAPGAETPGRERPGSCGARTAPRAAGDSSLNPEHNFALAEPGGADPSYFRRWLPRAPRGPSALEERAAPPPRVTVPLPERVRARRQGRGQTEGGGQRNLTPVGVEGQGDYLSPEEVRAARPAAWGRLQQSLLRPHPPRSAPTSRKV